MTFLLVAKRDVTSQQLTTSGIWVRHSLDGGAVVRS
jgi:hypothetical protein